MKAIITGNFDGLHLGHAYLIEELKNKSGEHVPFVFTYEPHTIFVIQNKYFPLLTPLEDKRFLLKKLFGLDLIDIPFSEKLQQKSSLDFSTFLYETYGVRKWLMGEDHHVGNQSIKGDLFHPHIEIIKTSLKPWGDQKISSSRIRSLLKEGQIESVNKLLGYDYFIQGIVVPGDKRGRSIGFPTANMQIDKYKALPKFGVYSCKILFDNNAYLGVVNIGKNPTFANDETRVEVHILNFSKDLYGKKIAIELKRNIRNEMKFDSINTLKDQIKLDIKKVKEFFHASVES